MGHSGDIQPVKVHMFFKSVLEPESLDYHVYTLVIDRIYSISCEFEVWTLTFVLTSHYLVDNVAEFINLKLVIQYGTGIFYTVTVNIQIILVNPHTVFITWTSRKFTGYFLYTRTAY